MIECLQAVQNEGNARQKGEAQVCYSQDIIGSVDERQRLTMFTRGSQHSAHLYVSDTTSFSMTCPSGLLACAVTWSHPGSICDRSIASHLRWSSQQGTAHLANSFWSTSFSFCSLASIHIITCNIRLASSSRTYVGRSEKRLQLAQLEEVTLKRVEEAIRKRVDELMASPEVSRKIEVGKTEGCSKLFCLSSLSYCNMHSALELTKSSGN